MQLAPIERRAVNPEFVVAAFEGRVALILRLPEPVVSVVDVAE
jgi:hypothetical protein